MGESFFLTGMQRSGTTLLEKLLDAHPEIAVLSQPFPFLFLEWKRAFLADLGYGDDPYPLGTLFREERYQPQDLAAFLERLRTDGAFLRRVFSAMESFSGQYTRIEVSSVDELLGDFAPTEPARVMERLIRRFSHKLAARWCGSKETVCEEFLPYLLGRGVRGALILRDVRDVLTSLNHGRGSDFGGRPKPTLFNVRGWRRSVAFALHLAGRPGFGWVRYEDLVAAPMAVLGRLTAAMGLPDFDTQVLAPILGGEIRDQGGRSWAGNSSHGAHRGISSASVGRYRGHLPPEVRRFVEAACYPELRTLGYTVDLDPEEIPSILREFQDPYPLDRPDLAYYANDPVEIEAEVRRFRKLGRSEESTLDFLLPGVEERLARGCDLSEVV